MLKSPQAAAPSLRFLLAHPAHAVALSGGLGLVPVWPGTVGAAGAVVVLPFVGAPWPLLLVALAATFLLGVWAADVTDAALGTEDAQSIVFDETWATAAVFLAVPAHPAWWIAGFLAFRFFDIVKPQPIRLVQDRVPGGLGVMADDLAAAVAAIAVLRLLAAVLPV